MANTTKTSSKKKSQPLRFAHPFFTTTPPTSRARMTDHIQGTLNPIPPVKGNSSFTLADVIGQEGSDGIAAAGQITIHIAGDIRDVVRYYQAGSITEALIGLVQTSGTSAQTNQAAADAARK
jgi:hypothetical protein